MSTSIEFWIFVQHLEGWHDDGTECHTSRRRCQAQPPPVARAHRATQQLVLHPGKPMAPDFLVEKCGEGMGAVGPSIVFWCFLMFCILCNPLGAESMKSSRILLHRVSLHCFGSCQAFRAALSLEITWKRRFPAENTCQIGLQKPMRWVVLKNEVQACLSQSFKLVEAAFSSILDISSWAGKLMPPPTLTQLERVLFQSTSPKRSFS